MVLPDNTQKAFLGQFQRAVVASGGGGSARMAVGSSQKIPTARINHPALGFHNFHQTDTCPSHPGPKPTGAMVRDGHPKQRRHQV